MDVEASRAIRQAEVGASQTMLVRTQECFGIRPQWLVGDTAYGSAPNLDWLVNTQGISPHVPVIDKSKREDGTFSREDFIYDEARDCYVCPTGKTLTTTGHIRDGDLLAYLATVHDCRDCPLKPNCCPRPRNARSCAAFMSPRAMSRARSPRLKRLRSRAAIARRSRCCSPISSAFCGSAVCAYEARAALSSGSR